MSRPQRLTAAFARTVTEPGVYSDGRGAHGLRLVVRSRSAGGVRKSWAQRLNINGRPLNLGLGPYPVVTLADARDQALANARDAYRGLDPRGDRQRAPTFAEAFETVVALHAANWSDGGRSEKQWRSSVATYVLPSLGAKSVAEVTAGDILAVLTPLWATKAETARRLKGRLSAVLRWAVAQQHRPDDPTAAVAAALPSNNGHRGHFAALAHSDIPAALATIDASAALPATKLVIRFLALTATRSSEARDATWSEIDTNTATWDIAAARTKTRKPHRVPLSTQALTVLAEARRLGHTSDLVFPGPTGRALSSEALSKLFRELAISGTPHGLRSSFRSWAADTGVTRELAEAALGHTVRGVEGAYQRSDLLQARRPVMQQWADHCTPTREHTD